MTQHDEVSGLRDIIRHDALMDARALNKLDEAKSYIQSEEFGRVIVLIEEAITLLKTTPSSNRAPGTLSLGLVE